MKSRQQTEREPVAAERDAAESAPRDSQKVEALDRGLALLKAFRRGDGPLGNAELAQRLGLSKPTVSRLAYTLLEAGFLSYDPKQRNYTLGPALIRSGFVALANLDIREMARGPLRRLAQGSSFNVGLGVRDRNSMVYIETFEGDSMIGLRLFAGSRVPLVTSAMGRAYLAGLPADERAEILAQLRPSFGETWPAIEEQVNAAVKSVEAHGFCLSIGGWRSEINGVGAPVRSADGKLFAINLGGPAYVLRAETLMGEHGPRLAETAREIERAIAFT